MSTNLFLVVLIIFNQIIHFTNSNNITCSNNGFCEGKQIICNNNEDCYLQCDGTNSCYYSTVKCPINGKCKIYCGINKNTCDNIIINATYSKSLYVYCADNECDDAILYCPHNTYNKYDHQCILSGTKTIDRITFYTQQGFNDINIQNIRLTESIIFCGSNNNQQYTCNINTQQNGCDTLDDKTCETYRLPTYYPTISPTNIPTILPTIIPTINPTQSNNPTYKPTNSPIEIYNNENKRLEFYIYYNDSNGINMILGKWMKYELLNTYQQFTILSTTNTEWNNAGLINITFCGVYNIYYNNNNENKYCQRFKQYGYYDNKNKNDENINKNRLPSNLNIPSEFNAEFVAYGTFGIYSDESINSFQLFIIDTFTSYLFQKTFNLNMNDRINTVGFDDTFEAIEIIVQSFNPTKQNAIDNTQNNNSDENINIILGILIGILFALTVIICIYGIRFYFITQKRKKNNIKNGNSNRNNNNNNKHNEEGIEGKKDNKNNDDNIIIKHRTQFKAIPSIAGLSITTNNTLNNDNNDIYLEDDQLISHIPGYYLTDNESNDDTYENDEKLQIISSIDDNPSSDSNDNKSVISSIISFRKRKKKHKNIKQQIQKHQRTKKIEIKKKSHEPIRKRSFHWGFTEDGSDIRYKHGENDDIHLKSQSVLTINNNIIELQCGNSIKQLELARNSSFHSHHINNIHTQSQFSSSFNSNISTNKSNISTNKSNVSTNKSNISHHFNIDEIKHDNTINDAQFLAALSPSVKSIEDMYVCPKSPDGIQKWTGQIINNNNHSIDDIILKKPLSPIKNQIEMNTLSYIIDEYNNDINCDKDNNKV